ncbi:glycine betaine uptake BCCT transporter [Salibacterium qingdaonense]|uniref:Glycine betaine transporter n=1 Tax=Salibacterium qingdaonense TaxID=266892 RepID=A0A1I4QSG8_9BACI|nr:BCCT family transporter [Salibacterium qingdaonense]SFM43012.1 glycine betaine transporter [Salibacterium qingdaonense]
MSKVGNVFWISLAISIIFVIWGAAAPDNLGVVSNAIQSFLTSRFGWLYILSVAAFLIFSIYLMFSKYGKLRLGDPDDRPEYSRITWFAMLFGSGMGIGLIFWGAAEPLSHFAAPPNAEPESIQAAENAMRYTAFHWGLQTWAVYTVIALAIAYFKFRRKAPGAISSTFQPLLGDKTQGWMGTVIDVIAVFATIFGVATSLGLGASQISGGLSFVSDLENTFSLQFIIIIVVTILFMISAWTGINRGIKYLSNINLTLSTMLIVLTFILGPTVFIFDNFFSTLLSYIQTLPSLSFETGGMDEQHASWIESWTIFYWAWFIAWSPFVGTFIARVSKGRTIREFVTGVLFAPSLFCVLWFVVFGGSSLYQELNGINTGLTDLAQEETLFGVYQSFDMSMVLIVIALLLISTFFVISADSATFVLGMQTTNGDLNPSNSVKMTWGVIQAAFASVLLASGGLSALQTASIASAFPFMFILLLMMVSLIKAFRQDYPAK